MRFQRVVVQALEHLIPPVEVTTADLERTLAPLYQRIGIPERVLETLTGVRARRFWPDGMSHADAATQVARRLLDRNRWPAERLGALVSTSVCKDFIEPPIASLVAGDLGLPETCQDFDVGHACLGFMTGMVTVATMIEAGQIEAGMVVAGEGSRAVTEATVRRLLQPGVDFRTYGENLATLTLGSMAVAALLVHERHATVDHRLLGGASLSATRHSRLCLGTSTEMKTDATRLLREGVALAGRTWQATRAELELAPEQVSRFLLHQVGKANHDALIASLGLPESRVPRLYPDHGNVGAAGVPFTLATAIERGEVVEGDVAVLMGIGSGLNCAMLGVRW